jgi:hypothetical protein
MDLDIHTAVQTAFLLALLGTLITVWLGVKAIRAGLRLPYFRKRNDRMWHGYRLVFSGVLLVGVAFMVNRFAEPVAYHYFPPSATVTQTPTITLTPTITQTPTITLTPTITDTPDKTNTPSIPEAVATLFLGTLVPNTSAVFSPLQFTTEIDESLLPVDPKIEFDNPVGHMYATFTYDQMATDVQWTALWYRNNELVHQESMPWAAGTGGYGYTDWDPAADEWVPGEYAVHIFVGMDWKVSGYFTVTGEAPTSTKTPLPSRTPTATRTPRPTRTPTLSPTPRPTKTPRPTATPFLSPTPTNTRTPTLTPTITLSPTPSLTPTVTLTRTPSITPSPTKTRWPTATNPPTKNP